MDVCVIGAGVIGVTTAWRFSLEGFNVLLVDSASPGTGASYANGGQLSYSYVAPLAEPSVFKDLPFWLLSRSSPLQFRPRFDLLQWKWCLKFLMNCNNQSYVKTTDDMISLSYYSRTIMDELLKSIDIDFNYLKNGKLIIYRNNKLLDSVKHNIESNSELSKNQKILTREECINIEPALLPIQNNIAGAVYTQSEESGDCYKFTVGLFKYLAKNNKIKYSFDKRIDNFEVENNRIVAAIDSKGKKIEADQYVVAAGVGSAGLLQKIGLNPLLYPLKGYSLSVPFGEERIPEISVTDYERRTVYAKHGDILRIAAMVGIGFNDTKIDSSRIDLIKKQVRELLPNLSLNETSSWAGLRPATPDGKPIIGKSRKFDNLWLNIGHGALGFTLACGSSALLTDMIADVPLQIDSSPFLPFD